MNSQCSRGSSFVTGLKRETYFAYSDQSIERFLLKDGSWKLKPYGDHGKIFYLHHYYFAKEKTFAFYVTMPENCIEAEKYLAKITLKNQNDERKYLTNVQEVMSMDSAPNDKNEVFEAKGVMLVPWSMLRKFLKWTNKEGKQTTEVHTTIDILV